MEWLLSPLTYICSLTSQRLKVDFDLPNLLKIPHLPPPTHYPCSVLGKDSALNLVKLVPECRGLGDYAVCSVPTGGKQFPCKHQGINGVVSLPRKESASPHRHCHLPSQQTLWLVCLFSLGLRAQEAAWPVAFCSSFCLETRTPSWRHCGCQPRVTLSALRALVSLAN